MTHFGIICHAAPSHLNDMIYIGCELKQRGHRVTLLGIEDTQAKALTAGLEFHVIGQSEFPKGSVKDISLWTQQISINSFNTGLFMLDWICRENKIFFSDTPDAIKALGIQALLVDQSSPAGGTVAEYINIPFVSICCALMFNQDPNVPSVFTDWNYNPSLLGQLRNRAAYFVANKFIRKPLAKVINDYRRKWNLSPISTPNESFSKLAQISQQPAEFEFPRKKLPSCFHFTGPFMNTTVREPMPFPYENLTGQPLIYASMGTLKNQLLWIFQMISEACVGLDVQLVISLGGVTSPESLPELFGNPIIVDYAPQLELLKIASLTITHGGLHTALESLSNGVPMLAIPISYEQPGVATRIAWTGTGEFIPLGKVKVEKIYKAIKKVLNENTYRNNALRLQEAIRRAGGLSRAADIVEQVAATGKPFLARQTH